MENYTPERKKNIISRNDFGIGLLGLALLTTIGVQEAQNYFHNKGFQERVERTEIDNLKMTEKRLNTYLQEFGNSKYSEARKWFEGSWYQPPVLDGTSNTKFVVVGRKVDDPQIFNLPSGVEIIIDNHWAYALERTFHKQNPRHVDTGPGYP